MYKYLYDDFTRTGMQKYANVRPRIQFQDVNERSRE